MALCDQVRANAAAIVADARHVRVDLEALDTVTFGGPITEPTLDPERHYLEGSEADVAGYLLTLDAINFGSGWFPTLRKRRGCSGYYTVAWGLADRFRADGPWSNAELRALRAVELAAVLGQPRDHELMDLFAGALRQLGSWLGERSALDVVRGARSAQALATELGRLSYWDDRGFYKRAQIVPSDMALAGIATFDDLDRLTIFADNLVPHVLRCEGVLAYDEALAAWIDAGRLLPPGRAEREIRAAAVHACAQLSARLGVPERVLDTWLWNRGQDPASKARPRHRTRCVYY